MVSRLLPFEHLGLPESDVSGSEDALLAKALRGAIDRPQGKEALERAIEAVRRIEAVCQEEADRQRWLEGAASKNQTQARTLSPGSVPLFADPDKVVDMLVDIRSWQAGICSEALPILKRALAILPADMTVDED